MVEILVNGYMHQDTSNGSLKLIFQIHTSKSQTKKDSIKGFICTVATYTCTWTHLTSKDLALDHVREPYSSQN